VAALDDFAHGRRGDDIGNLQVPDLGLILRVKRREQCRKLGRVCDVGAAQAKATGNVLKRCAAENGQPIVNAVCAKLVNFRAIGAVVHDTDQNPETQPLDRLKLLDVHHHAAIALDQNDAAAGAVATRRGDADGIRHAVADGAELANGGEPFGRAAAHVR